METSPREIHYYQLWNGAHPFKEWYDTLQDRQAKIIIQARITRLERGLLGDCKPIGQGVFELRIFYGPGYRIYFGIHQKELIILLMGGRKKTQQKDIGQAQEFWSDYLRRSHL